MNPFSLVSSPARRYQLNYTQELRGLGIANIAGAMFQW